MNTPSELLQNTIVENVICLVIVAVLYVATRLIYAKYDGNVEKQGYLDAGFAAAVGFELIFMAVFFVKATIAAFQ